MFIRPQHVGDSSTWDEIKILLPFVTPSWFPLILCVCVYTCHVCVPAGSAAASYWACHHSDICKLGGRGFPGGQLDGCCSRGARWPKYGPLSDWQACLNIVCLSLPAPATQKLRCFAKAALDLCSLQAPDKWWHLQSLAPDGILKTCGRSEEDLVRPWWTGLCLLVEQRYNSGVQEVQL